MSERRRVAVVTGSRADYGHLYWLLREIADDPALELQLIVTGMHLSPRFGNTVDMIVADGFAVAARVESLLEGDGGVVAAKSTGRGTIGLADAFECLAPDVAVVLGDRFEILAAATAALLMRIPLAHIHGGESTEGAVDDSIRHAITKMASLHFVAAEPYRRRVVQMGEDPDRVHLVGAPGLDALTRSTVPDRAEVEKALGLSIGGSPLFLVTYHPETAGGDDKAGVDALLGALGEFPSAAVVFTGVNADPGHDAVARAIDAFAAERKGPTASRQSLGQTLYLGTMKQASAVIGNSSSGLIEAPALGVPTVNIGNRQGGRLRAASVIDCPPEPIAVATAIRRAIDPAFRASWPKPLSLYGQGGAARRIKDALKSVSIAAIARKTFAEAS